MRRFLRVLAIGMFFSSAFPAAAQNRDLGGVGLTVFEEASYRGRNATLLNDVPNLQSIGMNDRISSLQTGPGERWQVCEHVDYRGRCQVVSGNESNLRGRGWNDLISSARRLSNAPLFPGGGGRGGASRGIELYSGTRFSGLSRTLSGPTSDLRRVGFGDRAMSLRLPPSEAWEVCDDTAYRDCRVVNSDWPDLRDLGMAQRISSARPWGYGRGGGFVPPPPAPQRLVLFENQSYRGRSLTITNGARILSDFMNRAESVQVAGGPWELCDQMDFGGRCVTVNRNVGNLADLGMRRRVISVRPARAVPR